MKPITLAIAAALLLAGPASASAQRVDVGGSASTFHVGYGNGTFVGAGPLVTYHFNDRHALQLVTDLRYQHTPYSVGVNGIYSVQYRRTPPAPSSGWDAIERIERARHCRLPDLI